MQSSRLWSRGAATIGVAVAMILRANHRERWWAGTLVKRGQLAFGQGAFAEALGLSRLQLRRILQALVEDGFCEIEANNRFTVVTICKYDSYQGAEDVARTTDEHQTNIKRTTDEHQTNTNKNDKELKEVCLSRARVREGCSQVVDNSGTEAVKADKQALLGGGSAEVAGRGEDGVGAKERFSPPDEAAVLAYAAEIGKYIHAQRFCAYWGAAGWRRGGRRVRDWRPLVGMWRDDLDAATRDNWEAVFRRAKKVTLERLEKGGNWGPEFVAKLRGEMGVYYRPGESGQDDAARLGMVAAAREARARLEREVKARVR